jgi:polyhydroxybutyrate depolymerase
MMSVKPALFIVLATLLAAMTQVGQSVSAQTPKRGLTNQAITIDGILRTYLQYVPLANRQSGALPLVLVLHGYGGNGKSALGQGKWVAKAEKEKFIVVALDGMLKDPGKAESFQTNQRGWNNGDAQIALSGVDDVAFVKGVIDTLVASGVVDEDRIYVTGFSNGAGMTYRVGAELSDQVAAIAPLSSTLFVEVEALARPVSLITFFGGADPIRPIEGGTHIILGASRTLHPAAESWATWQRLLNCPTQPSQESNQEGVRFTGYKPCVGGAEVAIYVIDQMGHHWPGGRESLPKALIGEPLDLVDATDLIWAFFEAHPRAAKLP